MHFFSKIMLLALAMIVGNFSTFAQELTGKFTADENPMSFFYVTNRAGIDFYAEKSETSKKIHLIPYTTKLEAEIDASGGSSSKPWLEASYKGTKGYILNKDVSWNKVPKDQPPVTRYANVRTGLILYSDTNAQTQLLTIPFGAACKVDVKNKWGETSNTDAKGNSIDGHWLRCTYKGKTGFVFSGYLSESPKSIKK